MRLLFLALLLIVACKNNDWKQNNIKGLKAYQQGRYKEAEKLFLVAIQNAKDFGLQDARLATSFNNLAEVYRNQGKLAEAEPLYKQSLEIWEKSLGPEHANTALNLTNLADLYHTQDRYQEAEPLYKRALAIFKKSRGDGHEHVGSAFSRLADVYRDQGKYAKAEEFYQKSVEPPTNKS